MLPWTSISIYHVRIAKIIVALVIAVSSSLIIIYFSFTIVTCINARGVEYCVNFSSFFIHLLEIFQGIRLI